ncbi:MAG: hydroxyisourate hydrolase [Gemmatimonadaceae bacterium]
MSAITTHVLDTALGRPAAGVRVVIERICGEHGAHTLAEGATDADGRARELLPAGEPLAAGAYRLVFDTGAYFAERGAEAFYPSITVVFEVRDGAAHYHVPLLLSPFGYSTYRGS